MLLAAACLTWRIRSSYEPIRAQLGQAAISRPTAEGEQGKQTTKPGTRDLHVAEADPRQQDQLDTAVRLVGPTRSVKTLTMPHITGIGFHLPYYASSMRGHKANIK